MKRRGGNSREGADIRFALHALPRVWLQLLVTFVELIALATPLFTQAIIDKVVVHRTQSTLIAIAVAMAVFTVFTSLLSWVRQYLVLHTGNRVDAVLGAAVWEHLLKLPVRYFEHRPTGVVAARYMVWRTSKSSFQVRR